MEFEVNEDSSPRTPESPIRVLVVDDQPLIRRGLALMLGLEHDIEVVAQAANGEEAVTLARQWRPHVVLMDMKMPVMGGVAATRAITGEHPATQVVVLTTYDTDELVFDAIRAGAQAYLLKDAGEDEVIETIRAVHRGETRLQPAIARKVMEELRRAPPASNVVVTDEPIALEIRSSATHALPEVARHEDVRMNRREESVLGLIAQGHSNKEIAQALSLAEGTIKNYTSRIMDKLHARSRTELAIKAMQRKAL